MSRFGIVTAAVLSITHLMATCFCTLAIHPIYRQRARLLMADVAPMPFVVLTDEPSDFADLPVKAIRHDPTGPMAVDYLERWPATGNARGAAAYHDKRFVIEAALRDFETAIFLDADSRFSGAPVPVPGGYPPGLSVTTVVERSVAEHLEVAGPWRRPVFDEMAKALFGSGDVLHVARWCHEACIAVTRDGFEDRFISGWGRMADIMRQSRVFSGEGGVIGLAAFYAGWSVDYEVLAPLAELVLHEGGGPKEAAVTAISKGSPQPS